LSLDYLEQKSSRFTHVWVIKEHGQFDARDAKYAH